jgi:hypothetical protein
MSVRLAEPPSEVGTGGGQVVVVDEWPEAATVEVAPCVEVSAPSPGNSSGTCEVFVDDALMPEALLLPPAPLPVDAALDADPPVPPAGDDPAGKACTGTLSGSEAVPLVEVV